jgi:hypothetical protein
MGRIRVMGWFQSSSSLVRYKILIHEDEHEDEHEKNQIRSHGYALRPQPSTLYHVPETSEP